MKLLLAQLLILFTLASRLMSVEINSFNEEHINLYLKRLNLSKDILNEPRDGVLLDKLVKAHLINIPFENLNMHTAPKTPVQISLHAVINKILKHHGGKNRGGYCHELSELFSQFLSAIGFDVKRHKASVWGGKDQGVIPVPSHQFLTVTIDGDVYLADIGFGVYNIFQAIKLPSTLNDAIVLDGEKPIRFEKVLFDDKFGPEQAGREGYLYQRWSERKQNFDRVSSFTLQTFEADDFHVHNERVQTAYQPFLDNVVFTRFTAQGVMIGCTYSRNLFENIDEVVEWINDANPDREAMSVCSFR